MESSACQGADWGYCESSVSCAVLQPTHFTCDDCMGADSSNAWCPAGALCATAPMPSSSLLVGDGALCPHDAWVNSCAPAPISDPFYTTNLWAFDLINVQPAWTAGITGAGVTINGT